MGTKVYEIFESINSRHLSRTPQGKEGEIDKNTEKRQDQATDRASGQWEPKGLFICSQQEGDKAQDSGEYGQQDGCDLGIPSLQVGT